MRDSDVWAPLTAVGDRDLYDTEDEELGGESVFHSSGNLSTGLVGRMVGSRPGLSGGQAVTKRAAGSGGAYSAVGGESSGKVAAL